MFFPVQVSSTETTSQMIQDDSQSTACETQPEKMENKKNFHSEEETRCDW